MVYIRNTVVIWLSLIKGFEAKNDCIERETMWYLGMVWKARQASELSRLG